MRLEYQKQALRTTEKPNRPAAITKSGFADISVAEVPECRDLARRRHKPTRENLINGNSRHVMESRILYGPHVAWRLQHVCWQVAPSAAEFKTRPLPAPAPAHWPVR
jgi:hypothetical protein